MKVFGHSVSEHISNNAESIQVYNDSDFYQALLKDFLATTEQTSTSQGYNDDDIYVDGADLGMT